MVFGGAVLPEVRASAAGWSECVSGALPEQEYVDLVKQAGFVDVSRPAQHQRRDGRRRAGLFCSGFGQKTI